MRRRTRRPAVVTRIHAGQRAGDGNSAAVPIPEVGIVRVDFVGSERTDRCRHVNTLRVAATAGVATMLRASEGVLTLGA